MKQLMSIKSVLLLPLIIFYLWQFGSVGNHVGAAPSGTILIGQIKLTSSNGQFVSLYNNTDTDIDMSSVKLAYYNYYDLASAKLTSSRFIPLSGKLPSRNYYMVNDGALVICYKMTVDAQSLGFSTTAGTLQVVQNGPSNVLDTVAWSKTAVSGSTAVQTLPTSTSGFLQRAWVDGVIKSTNDPWVGVVPSGIDSCDLEAQIAASSTPIAPTAQTTPQSVSIAKIGSLASATTNQGLVAPVLSELLPNPAPPQTDDADEFIELYNPNNQAFNLAGYRLEAGTSYSRGYTFTSGNLQPKSYTAFKITDTNLQLSNTEGQARLLAPDGTTISETPSYEDAPEGQSWSMVADIWQWTEKVTPNAANALGDESTNTTASTASKSKTTGGSTKKTSSGNGMASNTASGTNPSQLNDAAPLHPLILAGIGTAAVAYAIYEYRKDMANSIFKLRRYLRNRRTVRARL